MKKVNLRAKKNRREALAVLAKGTVLSLFAGAGYLSGRNHRMLDQETAPVPALMIVWNEKVKQDTEQNNVRNSTLVRKACESAGVEFRMYRADADLFQCDSWERNMFNAAKKFGTPSIVIVDKSGVGRCYPIPRNIKMLIDIIDGVAK
ncbi:MAG: hypothetical protein ACR2NF_11115 [Pirellulales bacterium]